jgi:hypothetical protein
MYPAFKDLIDQLDPTLQKLVNSEPYDITRLPKSPRIPGVYVFYDESIPVYVGRTRNLKARMKSHFNLTNPNMASFAFLIACSTYGRIKASYKKEGSRKDLRANPDFNKHFISANNKLKTMIIRFIEIDDPKMQHLFEIYATMTLNTSYNNFDTY